MTIDREFYFNIPSSADNVLCPITTCDFSCDSLADMRAHVEEHGSGSEPVDLDENQILPLDGSMCHELSLDLAESDDPPYGTPSSTCSSCSDKHSSRAPSPSSTLPVSASSLLALSSTLPLPEEPVEYVLEDCPVLNQVGLYFCPRLSSLFCSGCKNFINYRNFLTHLRSRCSVFSRDLANWEYISRRVASLDCIDPVYVTPPRRGSPPLSFLRPPVVGYACTLCTYVCASVNTHRAHAYTSHPLCDEKPADFRETCLVQSLFAYGQHRHFFVVDPLVSVPHPHGSVLGAETDSECFRLYSSRLADQDDVTEVAPTGDVRAISAFLDFTGWNARILGADMRMLVALTELPSSGDEYSCLSDVVKQYMQNVVEEVISACNFSTRRALLQTNGLVCSRFLFDMSMAEVAALGAFLRHDIIEPR